MTTNGNPLDADFPASAPGSDADLDMAIDNLRGVLKNDDEGTLPDLGGSDFPAFGGGLDTSGEFGGAAAGGGFGMGDFGGNAGFGGGGAFGADMADHGRMQAPGSALNANLDLIMDIPIDVQIVLGTSRMQVSGLMNLTEGATIALDKKIGEPVEIMVNGRRIARGEITVLENDDTRFGVKLIEVLSTRKA